MLEKMIFGRFIPGTSFVHRLDPRSKLTFVFLFIMAVFLANNAATYAILIRVYIACYFQFAHSLIFLTQWIKADFIFNRLYISHAYLLYERRRTSAGLEVSSRFMRKD